MQWTRGDCRVRGLQGAAPVLNASPASPALSHFPTDALRQHPTQKRPQARVWLRKKIGDKILWLCYPCEGLFSARVRKVWLLLHAAMLV